MAHSTRLSMAALLEQHIERTPTCWIWAGSRDRGGYGMLRIDRVRHWAHRLAYEEWVGAIPDGLEIDHLCRRHDCVNPKHLEPVTHRENMRRGISPAAHALRFDRCIHGHEFDDANTYRPPGNPGRRICRTCVDRRLLVSRGSPGRRR